MTRSDIAAYVNAVFGIYAILIICNILLSWIPRIPRVAMLRPLLDFIKDTTDPYLNLFRRVMNPVGPGAMKLDFSPILALIVLFIVNWVIVGAIINP